MIWVGRRVHAARKIALPLPWWDSDESPDAGTPRGQHDGPVKSIIKTLLTIAQIIALPWQGAVVVACLVWQLSLYFAGFGGGRPGGVPIGMHGWNPLGKLFYWLRDGLSNSIAPYILHDPRNAPYLPWMLALWTYTPFVFYTFASYYIAHREELALHEKLGMAYAYHALRMGPYFKMFAHAATLIHKEGHANKTGKGIFKIGGFVLNHLMEWWAAFFYGHVPENYRVGHVEVHHGEGNDHGDVTSTLHVDRSTSSAFVRYMADFGEFWTNWSVVTYFNQKIKNSTTVSAKDQADRLRAVAGMIAFYGVGVAMWYCVDPFFCYFYFIQPHLETINYLSAINYTWHTFADPDDHSNEYVKSITILEGQYNLFNEDFHVEHHLRPGLHWSQSEMSYNKRIESCVIRSPSSFLEESCLRVPV